MAGEVVYADIRVPGGASHSGPPRPAARRAKRQPCPPWHRPLLRISGVLHIMVVFVGFIGFVAWALRTEVKNTSGIDCATPPGSEPSCPTEWHQHGRKCYFFSNQLRNWSASHEDCSTRGSRLAVIEDKAELELDFMKPQVKATTWIGLFNTTPGRRWTWVNGSAYMENTLQVLKREAEESCGTVRASVIGYDSCNAEWRWICQKDFKGTL
ncbi:killer cell lectin-like receptor subfamily B member 1B allele B [Lissotriton helveticus]